MQIYDKPVRRLMHEMVEDIGLSKGSILERAQVHAWFEKNYPKIKRSTVNAHLIRMSTNAPSRVHYKAKEEDELFYQIDKKRFRLYDLEKDPSPIYDETSTGQGISKVRGKSSLLDSITVLIEDFESIWLSREKEYQARIKELEAENAKLRELISKEPTIAEEIKDDVLRDRVSRLTGAPMDTLIREAGVILEERLRIISGIEEPLYGVKLVDAVLAHNTGSINFSTHQGEQEGVRMLFRGAIQFIRNPPMHRLIEYHEATVRNYFRLIDAFLELLSEAESKNTVGIKEVRRMLTRRRIPAGQLDLYRILAEAGEEGVSGADLAKKMNRTRSQISGVLGALGNRINRTEGLEGKGGTVAVIEITETPDGDWRYIMRPVLREALKAEGII
jgi:hypothetical protein